MFKLTPDGYKTWRWHKKDLEEFTGERILAPIYVLGLPGDVAKFKDKLHSYGIDDE